VVVAAVAVVVFFWKAIIDQYWCYEVGFARCNFKVLLSLLKLHSYITCRKVYDWIGLAQDRNSWRGLVNSVEPLGSIKCWKIAEWPHNWGPLE
jgi:hypothetical protein